MENARRRPADLGRRDLLRTIGSAGGLVVLAGCATAGSAGARDASEGGHEEAEVTPGEDLMQEHGVLERILLIYDEAARRIDQGGPFDAAPIASAAAIIRRFVEDYHEKLEEKFVFPRLEAARREAELTAVLRQQHKRGRELTDEVLRLVRAGTASPQLAQTLRSFERMYRPHAAREETVLLPAFRRVVGGGYRELGAEFEEQEHQLFGEGGFEKTVAEVASIEAALGIGDLAKFTA